MEQLNLFEDRSSPIFPPDILEYYPDVFTAKESKDYLSKFLDNVQWEQKTVQMYGKEVLTPRLTAWYGDTDKSDANVCRNVNVWTAELLEIKQKVENLLPYTFDSVLLNFYRNGNDSVSWHSDNDGVLGKNKIVASVSFGEARYFDFRKTINPRERHSLLLENGSCLLMKGNFQDEWQHRIAKSTKSLGARVNLTFRQLH